MSIRDMAQRALEKKQHNVDENVILAGILWKFLREESGSYLLDGGMLLLTTSVELSAEEEALLKELKQRKDLKI